MITLSVLNCSCTSVHKSDVSLESDLLEKLLNIKVTLNFFDKDSEFYIILERTRGPKAIAFLRGASLLPTYIDVAN